MATLWQMVDRCHEKGVDIMICRGAPYGLAVVLPSETFKNFNFNMYNLLLYRLIKEKE